MASMLEKDLEEIGLDQKEARVYLSALELGESVVQKIARQAGVNRATTYFIIESLTKMGLMSSIFKGKKQFFIAADPDKLAEILEYQKSDIERKKEALTQIMPQLQAFSARAGRPVVKLYEGKEGLNTLIDEFAKTGKGTMNMAYSLDSVRSVFPPAEREKAFKKRIQKNIQTKVIYTFKEGIFPDEKLSVRRKIPLDKFPITFDFAVLNDRVRIASLKNRLVGIMIEDKEIAASLKAVLDLAWEAAEKYDKEFKKKK